jgi:RNA polymerase sigma-70 factor (ECF subfamily)
MLEATLIAAARLGDQDAFTELYRLHVRYVRAVGRAVLHSDDLDDLCQDVFLLAFTRLHSFEGNSSFRTWMTRIAINQCLLTLRRRRQASNGGSQLVQMDAEMLSDDAPGGSLFASEDIQLEGVPVRLDLDRMLKVLKPAERRMLEMAYVEDVPDQEIAEILGIRVDAVRCKILRAKRRVRNFHDKA